VYSPADSNHSSSSGVSSDPRYIKANSSTNNMNNNSTSPPYETNASLASHGRYKTYTRNRVYGF
jgi:hypothetical protein